jgi:hypothetical protein
MLPGNGKIIDQSIAPHAGEVVDQKQGGPDKFLDSDLDHRLKDHAIKTVILCATSAQGVGLGTGTAAAQRGYYVVYPVDCASMPLAIRQLWLVGVENANAIQIRKFQPFLRHIQKIRPNGRVGRMARAA